MEKDFDGYKYGKNDLFALVIMMKTLLTPNEFRSMIYEINYEIEILDSKITTVPLDDILHKIGFPSNWKDIIKL